MICCMAGKVIPPLAPIRIPAGVLSRSKPWSDLTVSPQHRIHFSDWRTELLYGQKEVLVPAKALLGVPGVRVVLDEPVTYYHLLCDRHELVNSNGVISESLHPGEVANTALGESGAALVAAKLGGTANKRKLACSALSVSIGRAICGYAA